MLFLSLGVAVNTGIKAAISGGESSTDFATLCAMINLADRTITMKEETTAIDSIAQTIAAINMSLAGSALEDRVDETKAINQLEEPAATKAKGLEEHWNFLQKGRAALKAEDRTKYSVWKAHPKQENRRQAAALLAKEAATLFAEATRQRQLLTAAPINDALKTALYGESKQPSGVKAATATRENECGPTGGAGGAAAGASLMLDALCVCGKHSSEGSGEKNCGKDWASAPYNTAWTPNEDSTALVTGIINKCHLKTKPKTITRAAVEAATNSFMLRLGEPRGENKNLRLMLGAIEGAGAAGCTGQHNGGAGPCLQYKPAYFTGEEASLPWLVQLNTAVTKLEAANAANRRLKEIDGQLRSLNTSLTSLLHTTGN
uniref:Variant surface glycoprotein 1528 n=1 Tax=Trypanosoma brucei TaxID=5691 RepID=M4SWL9_9TRYP|nr:variant surface glycoprotein 1528 [Trypanosoma brucei]